MFLKIGKMNIGILEILKKMTLEKNWEIETNERNGHFGNRKNGKLKKMEHRKNIKNYFFGARGTGGRQPPG